MSLIETARDFVKGLVATDPEVGDNQTTSADGEPPDEQAASERQTPDGADRELDDELERARLEWESEPSHH